MLLLASPGLTISRKYVLAHQKRVTVHASFSQYDCNRYTLSMATSSQKVAATLPPLRRFTHSCQGKNFNHPGVDADIIHTETEREKRD